MLTNSYFSSFPQSNERALRSLVELRSETDLAMSALRCECGASDGAAMQHCLRVIMNRIQRTRSVRKAYIQEVDGVSTPYCAYSCTLFSMC